MRKALLLLLLGACRPTNPEPQSTAIGEKQSSAALHAPDVRFYCFPDSLVFEGHAALRERFGRLFAAAPQVHATTDARMVHGDFVVWQETATDMPGGKTDTQIFVWKVHNGLITTVMGIR